MHSFLYEKLLQYASSSRLRLHMPGHGGALNIFDVTELAETDDLLQPTAASALILDEERASKLFDSKLTLFCAGGATLCLQSALAFFVRRLGSGIRVLCSRGVHRSILHAFALLDIDPEFVDDPECVDDETLIRSDLFVFTGNDYFGHVPDYEALSLRLRTFGVKSIVDNAHGTHLKFLEGGRLHPLSYDFDLVIDSAHKTLSALTGAALLHAGKMLSGEAQSLRGELCSAMRLFSTTSPSFVLLVSLAEALADLEPTRFEAVAERVERVRRTCGIHSDSSDPLRLTLRGSLDFKALEALLKESGIYVEFSQKDALVMLFPTTFDDEAERLLTETLLRLLPRVAIEANPQEELAPRPEKVMKLREAMLSETQLVSRTEALGRISAEALGHYPPATALCMPGERLTREVLSTLDCDSVRVVVEKEHQ